MKKIIYTISLLLITQISQAQVTVTGNDIAAGKSLIEAYLSPFGNSLGASLNNGWYNTAKPHKLGGFDVTFTLNMAFIGADHKSFNLDDITKGTNFVGDENTPTFLGDNTNGAWVSYPNEDGVQSFQMPDGIVDLGVIPLPMLQGGVGLIKGTEIDVRYLPLTEIGKIGEINMFGVGVKHDILQWIPLASALPISVSIQAGHTNVNTAIVIPGTSEIEDQDVSLNVKATTINLLVSKKILMLTGYAGIGYNSSTTTFEVTEKYTIGTGSNAIAFDPGVLTKLEFQTENDFRMNFGLRFQLAILAIQANYTLSEYPVATIGLGISIR